MRRTLIRELRHQSDGAAGAEFALVLPLVIVLLLGMMDVGRYMWTVNQLEKATQVGARMAVVTDMIPDGLATTNYGTTLGQGAVIPTSSFGAAQCQKPAAAVTCTCETAPCPTLTPIKSAAFNALVARMRLVAPDIAPSNVSVLYQNSGLGYAGDPNGPDVAPLVTVTAANVRFAPLILFGGSISMKKSASLTLEDASGSTSN